MKNALRNIIRPMATALAVVSVALCFTGCSKFGPDDSRTVLVIDGTKVTYDEFRYVYMNSKADMTGRGDESDEGSLDEEKLDENVLSVFRRNYGILRLCRENSIELDDADNEEISNAVLSAKGSYTDKEFAQMLDDEYMSEYCFRHMLEIQKLWGKLYDFLGDGVEISDDDLIADVHENFTRVKYILIRNDADDDVSENRKKAEALLGRIRDGEDFEALIKDYCEDVNMVSSDLGYYYTKGQIAQSAEDAVAKIDVGGVTDVLEVDAGFIIMKKYPLDDTQIKDNLSDLRESYRARIVNEKIDEAAQNTQIEFTKLYHKLGLANMK